MATISANYDTLILGNNPFDSEIKVKRIPNRVKVSTDPFALNNNLFDSVIKVKRIPNRVSILVDSYPQGSSSSSSNTPVMYWS